MRRPLAIVLLLPACGLVADVPKDASVDRVEEQPPCAALNDTGVSVTTEFVAGAPPTLVPYPTAPDLGLYVMKQRKVYGTGTDPSTITRKTVELLPNGFIASVRVDAALAEHRVRYETDSGKLENGAHLRTVCGETETWTFELVPLEETRLALVGRRGKWTVVEWYDPPPPL